MSYINICDHCGEQITAANCPDGRSYVVKIGGWKDLRSPITFSCDNLTRTIDLCKACNDELMLFLGMDKQNDNDKDDSPYLVKDVSASIVKDDNKPKDQYNRWDVRNE